MPFWASSGSSESSLVLQAHHTDLEKLVDHVGKDGDELEPLQDRQALIIGEVQ
jgi:hypothetical protein